MRRLIISITAVAGAVLCAPVLAAETSDSVGGQVCAMCHSAFADGLEKTIHAKAGYFGGDGATCETCHGPGGRHAASGQAAEIINPSKAKGEVASKACVGCHGDRQTLQHWAGSTHDSVGIGCVGCHSVHGNQPGLLKAASELDTCVGCHTEQRANLRKRSTHPLREATRADGTGQMACSSCHNPHGGVTDHLIAANSVNDKCYECHQEKKAPVLWEHSAVKENCLTCHNPHGSNHEMMLTAKRPRLCQQCHEQGRHQTLAGQPESFFVANRGCSNCHASIHGSNNPSAIKIKN